MNDEYTVIPLPLWFCLIVALLFSCSACTTTPERYLSAEEDADLKANCEAQGCTIIPTPIWLQIEAILKRSGAI